VPQPDWSAERLLETELAAAGIPHDLKVYLGVTALAI